MIKIDNTPPGTRRRLKKGAAARRGREPSKTAVGGAENKEQMRQNRMRREREANMAMVKTPSKATTAVAKARAMGRQAAADPKATRPAKPAKMPSAPKAPAADKMKITKGATAPTPRPKISPEPQKPALTKKPTVTGTGGRNVSREGPSGTRTRANVTREQLKKTGLGLRDYLNFMDKKNKRPTKADAAEARAITAEFKAKKAKKTPEKTKDTPRANMALARKTGTAPKKMMGGGMMKSKMKAKGMKAGGKMKAKGYMAGGKMKSKMSTKGGAMGGPRKFKEGDQVKRKGKFPDLNKDGKVTQADILQGRGVIGGRSAAAKKKANTKKTPAKKASDMKSMLMPGMTTAKVPASAMERPTGKTFEKGGKVKPKGYKVGGKMKAKGGAAGGKKQKVRGAGIARKGVRPAKMR